MEARFIKSSFVGSVVPVAQRGFVVACAVLLLFIGASVVADPVGFEASVGIWMPSDPRLASDMRGSGGVLLATAGVMLAGVFRRRLWGMALITGGTVYLAYGLARVAGMALDGVMPGLSVGYAALELVVGGMLAWMAHRHPNGNAPRC